MSGHLPVMLAEVLEMLQPRDGANYIETVWGRGYVLRDPNGNEEAQVA